MKGLGASAVSGQNIGNTLTGLSNIGNTVVNAITAGRGGGGGYTHNETHNHIHERELTQEEKDEIRERTRRENETHQQNAVYRHLEYAQNQLNKNPYFQPPKKDHTPILILGIIITVAILSKTIK